ncbi:DegT/DnrJ/EryC1/StrS family aminotransferase, partial [bacterium]
MIHFGRPIIGEEEKAAVLAVLGGPILTHGPLVKQFEAAFAESTGAEHAVALASCTAALHLAYFYLGLGPGDEVIVPSETHVATAHAVELCGARPVFVDSEEKTGNLDLDRVEAAITPRTRALSIVHYLGMPVEMDRVQEIARRHELFVVEDAALALGTRYKGIHAGLWGDVGCFSFYPVKHITTAEGGMLTTRRPEIAARISMVRAFGIDRNVPSERKVPGMYDVEALGFNYRMNELGAALGIEQMKRLPELLRRRRENYETLSRALE